MFQPAGPVLPKGHREDEATALSFTFATRGFLHGKTQVKKCVAFGVSRGKPVWSPLPWKGRWRVDHESRLEVELALFYSAS
ncbi:MAG: hypothetical protein OXI63_03930, partial [Candidatus Poribacteria bacterium]|nr:hypothetical protein [Candidatus Poribacteria bacterium]